MKILLYNIQYGTGIDGALSSYLKYGYRYLRTPRVVTHQINQYIASVEADLTCLLEVDRGSFRHRRHCQIHSHFQGQFHIKKASKYRDSYQKWPIFKYQSDAFIAPLSASLKVRAHYLSKGMKTLVHEVALNGVHFFSVHLSLLSQKKRVQQLNELKDILNQCSQPYVVMGDFNAFRGLDFIHTFCQQQQLKLLHTEFTFPAHQPKIPLDLVLYSPSLQVELVEIPTIKLSDHLPVIFKVLKPE